MDTKKALSAIAVAATVVTLGVGPAQANDDDVIRRGGCDGGTTWKLKASPENGRIEVEGEIDSNRNGQVWRWRLMHNGSMSARGRATTAPPSGSFEVRRVVVDLSGVDRMRFRARNQRTGEVCVGRVRF